MAKPITELSSSDFDIIVERAVDKRLGVWLEQLMDALSVDLEESDVELRTEFVTSLRQSLAQADRGEFLDVAAFRQQYGR